MCIGRMDTQFLLVLLLVRTFETKNNSRERESKGRSGRVERKKTEIEIQKTEIEIHRQMAESKE